jgi:hypothetical protein
MHEMKVSFLELIAIANKYVPIDDKGCRPPLPGSRAHPRAGSAVLGKQPMYGRGGFEVASFATIYIATHAMTTVIKRRTGGGFWRQRGRNLAVSSGRVPVLPLP